jgi:hypothetical protein
MKTMSVPHRRYFLVALMTAVLGLSLAGCAGGGSGTASANALVVLTCHDSPGQQGPGTAPARLVNGVDGFIGDTSADDSLPAQILDGHRYLAWKAALSVAPGARPYRTVSVVSPATARLSYGAGSRATQPSRRVRLPACGDRYALYVGGILVRHPACVTLAVTAPAHRPATVVVPVLEEHC